MKIYNTYTNQLEEFKPIKDGVVTMYVCGPTVYNYCHIGNARPIIVFDTLKKYFIHKGYKVIHASNFTDINEKILSQSRKEGMSEMEIAQKYIDAYLDVVRMVGADEDYLKPRVSENIENIIHYIDDLVKTGHAYANDGDVYFKVSSIPNYGALSNRKVDELKAGARVEVREEKENAEDFALWKKFDEGITFDSPWGKGRPGWHTECSVMINHLFGGTIDIHGGGTDLIFPHHENEIAQNEALYGNHIANYWMHNARINMGSEKMSKSLGNVIWTKDLTCDKLAFRLLCLSFPYRNIISYTEELQQQFVKEWDKIKNVYSQLFLMLDLNDGFNKDAGYGELLSSFDQALENDLSTPNALTSLNDLMKLINQELRGAKDIEKLSKLYNAFTEMLFVLGLEIKKERLSQEAKNLYNEWNKAKAEKDFAKADSLREELKNKGII